MKASRRTVRVFFLAVAASAAGQIRADMGSVWIESVTSDSMVVDWTDPEGRHQLATEIPIYKVCWAASESQESICDVNSEVLAGSSSKPYVITGLYPGARYRVRVEAHAEKVSKSGEWVNPKFRHVGTVQQSTDTPEPRRNLRLSDSTDTSLSVEFINDAYSNYDKIRLAYKAKWSSIELNSTARAALGPSETWNESNEARGWEDILSTGPALRVTFSQLSPCADYEMVVYGFNIGLPDGERLGDLVGGTAGSCIFKSEADAVAADHQDVLARYAREISVVHEDTSVFQLVASDHPELDDAKEVLIVDSGDDLEVDFTALRFLIGREPQVFESWQVSEESGAPDNGLALLDFLAEDDPALLASLRDEVDPVPPPRFLRGDANRDGAIDVSDTITTFGYLFLGSAHVGCEDAADSNDDGVLDVSDAVYTFDFLFRRGARIPAPFGDCGSDPSEDALVCEGYSICEL